MSKSIARRSIALLTAVLVMTAFTFIITENASAASKKTCYLATKVLAKDKNGKIIVDETYVYDKNGLLKERKDLEGDRTYTRNGKGHLTGSKGTDAEGKKWTAKVTRWNKYGLPLEIVMSEYGTETYEYKGKLVRKITDETEKGETTVTKLDSHWNMTSYVYKNENGEIKAKLTCKFTYYKSGAKKGHPKKTEATLVDYSKGKKETKHATSTYKYKVNKHGKITKVTEIKTGDETGKTVVTIKYKKFKVPKKYRSLLKEWINPAYNL